MSEQILHDTRFEVSGGVAGMIVGIVLTLVKDQSLHIAGVFPPWASLWLATTVPCCCDCLSCGLRHRGQLHHGAARPTADLHAL